VTSQDTTLKLIYGTHALQDQLTQTEMDKWNPQYSLAFVSDSDTEFTVQLSIHPGALQSGSDWRVYYMTLGYAGGLP
jgi:hypothetical protein